MSVQCLYRIHLWSDQTLLIQVCTEIWSGIRRWLCRSLWLRVCRGWTRDLRHRRRPFGRRNKYLFLSKRELGGSLYCENIRVERKIVSCLSGRRWMIQRYRLIRRYRLIECRIVLHCLLRISVLLVSWRASNLALVIRTHAKDIKLSSAPQLLIRNFLAYRRPTKNNEAIPNGIT